MRLLRPLPLTLIGLVTALIVAGWAVFAAFLSEDGSRVTAVRSTQVMADLRRIEASLLDAETGQRGYVLTGNPTYLEPYNDGSALFPTLLADLRARLDGVVTDRQRGALAELETLGNAKLAELAETIALFDAGDRKGALALINSDLGKSLMDDVRVLTKALESEERAMFTSALRQARASQSFSGWVLVCSLAMIVLLVAALAYMFTRSERLDRTEDLLNEVTLHRDRTILLAQELSHRTKNLFGIVNSIVRMTGRTETDTNVAIKKISDRIGALSRAHSLTTTGEPDATVDLDALVQVTLEPYATEDRVFITTGEPLNLDSANLTPLGLILHELATNAVKYGVWSKGGGKIEITWATTDPVADTDSRGMQLTWKESQAPDLAATEATELVNSGFGSRMIEASVQQLNGAVARRWENGLVIEITGTLATRGKI